jgi:molecular chaperone DnaK
MIHDAEAHATEDRTRRQEIELRNRADGLAYQVERTLQEFGERVAPHDKARAEQLVAQVRTALKENASAEHLRQLTSDLEQLLHMLGAASQQPEGATAQRNGATAHDNVVDAEFTEKR